MLAQFQSRRAAAGLRRAVMLVLDNGADSRKTIWAFFGARAGEEAGVLGSAAEGSRRQRIGRGPPEPLGHEGVWVHCDGDRGAGSVVGRSTREGGTWERGGRGFAPGIAPRWFCSCSLCSILHSLFLPPAPCPIPPSPSPPNPSALDVGCRRAILDYSSPSFWSLEQPCAATSRVVAMLSTRHP